MVSALGVLALTGACAGEAPRGDAPDGLPTLVSLNPCVDAILVEIAASSQILALSHYSRGEGGSIDPALARRFGVTGGTAEEIIALAPDLVLASTFIDPATRAALERAGLRIETFGGVESVAASRAQVARIAALAGDPGRADALLGQLGEGGAPPPDPAAPGALLWQAGEIVPGQRTLIVELIAEAGFADHAAALGLGQADRVALEQVIADPPDLLLVAGESAGQLHPALQALPQTRVHRFDPRLFYCGGPSIIAARAELAALRASLAHRQARR
jgi:iron complex transport system substrate-binding protein